MTAGIKEENHRILEISFNQDGVRIYLLSDDSKDCYKISTRWTDLFTTCDKSHAYSSFKKIEAIHGNKHVLAAQVARMKETGIFASDSPKQFSNYNARSLGMAS